MATQTWTSGTCTVTLDDDGVLLVKPTNGISGEMDDVSSGTPPWIGLKTDPNIINKLRIAPGVTSIGARAFTGIGTKYIDQSTGSIPFSAVELEDFPDSVTIIKDRAFYESCFTAKNLKLPAKLVKLNDYAFKDAYGMTGLDPLPGTLEYLGIYSLAFSSGKSTPSSNVVFTQEELVVPESVTYIGSGALGPCGTSQTKYNNVYYRANCDNLDFTSFNWTMIDNFYNFSTRTQTTNNDGYFKPEQSNNFCPPNPNLKCYSYPTNTNFRSITGKYWYDINAVITDWTVGTVLVKYNPSLKILSVTGEGELPDYSAADKVPWNYHSSKVINVEIGENITKLGNYCLAGLTNAVGITNRAKSQTISSTAFDGDNALTTLYGYPENSEFKTFSGDKWVDINTMAMVVPFIIDGREAYPKTIDKAVTMYDNRTLQEAIADIYSKLDTLLN